MTPCCTDENIMALQSFGSVLAEVIRQQTTPLVCFIDATPTPILMEVVRLTELLIKGFSLSEGWDDIVECKPEII